MKNAKLKCAVVDDSGIQRAAIIRLIEKHPSLELVAEYRNAIETKNGLLDQEIELIFLDIEMPILTGFDLLDDLPSKPHIIFVTGQTKYAFRAFDYDAVDFLHKPITAERFKSAVKKVLKLHMLSEDNSAAEDEDYIFVKSNLRNRKVHLKNLKYIEALGDYVRFITDQDVFMVLSTLKQFEEELPQKRFMRIHKSFLVNLERVDHYNSREIVIEGEKLPLSRTRKENFVEALNAVQ